jgi:hypothetical protein
MLKPMPSSAIALLTVLVFLSGCKTRETLLYQDNLESTDLRYEVYASQGTSIMPGSVYGGPGRVKVYNKSGVIVLDKNIKSTYADIVISENELIIAGEGAFKLPNK